MHDRDKIQDIVYDVEKCGADGSLWSHKAMALIATVDPDDEYEVNHPLNIGETMTVSAIGSSANDAISRLVLILRRLGFEGPIVKNYSEDYYAIQIPKREKADKYKLDIKRKRNMSFLRESLEDSGMSEDDIEKTLKIVENH